MEGRSVWGCWGGGGAWLKVEKWTEASSCDFPFEGADRNPPVMLAVDGLQENVGFQLSRAGGCRNPPLDRLRVA